MESYSPELEDESILSSSPASSPMSISSNEESQPGSPASSTSSTSPSSEDPWSSTMINPYYYSASKSVRWYRDHRGLWSERTGPSVSKFRSSTPYQRNHNTSNSHRNTENNNNNNNNIKESSQLINAVQRQDLATLRHLLAAGQRTNLNVVGSDGDSALHRSCRQGDLDIVKLLVRYGADPELANRDGWSPLHLAVHSGCQDVAVYLLSLLNNRR